MNRSIVVLALSAILATPALAADPAEGLYKASCAACHDAGVSGSPKLGDKAAWAPRIAKGVPALTKTAIEGSKVNPVMMARGGSKLSDAELKAVVEYMVSRAK